MSDASWAIGTRLTDSSAACVPDAGSKFIACIFACYGDIALTMTDAARLAAYYPRGMHRNMCNLPPLLIDHPTNTSKSIHASFSKKIPSDTDLVSSSPSLVSSPGKLGDLPRGSC